MAKRLSKNLKRKYSWIAFWIFSSILFINNTTQMLSLWFDLSYEQISFISFAGIILSLAYVLWLND